MQRDSGIKAARGNYFVRHYTILANCSALMTSTHTKGSLPLTQASCPGGIVYDIPGWISVSDPSFKRMRARPTRIADVSHLATVGLYHGLYTFRPAPSGLELKRPSVKSFSRTTSSLVFCGDLSSSGVSWDLASSLLTCMSVATTTSLSRPLDTRLIERRARGHRCPRVTFVGGQLPIDVLVVHGHARRTSQGAPVPTSWSITRLSM